jgi:hypothetical protein
VVDRTRQLVEEGPQGVRIVRVEGRRALGIDVERGALEPLAVAADEDDVRALLAGAAGGLEPDPGTGADQHDGLALELRLMRGHAGTMTPRASTRARGYTGASGALSREASAQR